MFRNSIKLSQINLRTLSSKPLYTKYFTNFRIRGCNNRYYSSNIQENINSQKKKKILILLVKVNIY